MPELSRPGLRRHVGCELAAFLQRNPRSARWQPLAPARTFQTADPKGLFGATDFADAYAKMAGKAFALPEIGNLHVRDGHVAGYGLVTRGDSLLHDRNLTIPREELGHNGFFTDLHLAEDEHVGCDYPQVRELDAAIMLLHRGDMIHGHWLLEALPRVLLGRAAGLADPFYIVSAEIRGYQVEMLEALGVARDRIVEIGRRQTIRCGTLVVPSIAHVNQLWVHPFANETFDFLVRHASAAAAPERPARIFVTRQSRRDDPRPLLNDDAVEKVLVDAGFAVIDPGKLGWVEQIAIFAAARDVVGIGGSGLHNTVFCGAAANVLTLQPNQNWNYLQASIAAVRGHRNSFFFGESMAAFDPTSWETPFVVDTDLLAMVLDRNF